MNKYKILHITDLHFRHKGRLFYSTGKKINNGFILNGHNVLNISDRDVTFQKKNIFDFESKAYLYNLIIENIENFKPDIIVFGHVDRLTYNNFLKIKKKYNFIKFTQWFLDPLNFNGPDFEKNKKRFFLKYQFCDSNFITTSPKALTFVNLEKTFFIPNPIDPSIDIYKNFLSNKSFDVFIAISHGQHRGILKKHFVDDRVKIIQKLTKKIRYNIFGYKRSPIWGQNFFDEMNKCSMGINLSRGYPIEYYSSDRIAALLGNGLLTFIHKDYNYQKFLSSNEIITYDNINDLNKKILYFKNNPKKTKSIASNGYTKAHRIFNNKIISQYIIDKTMGHKIKNKYIWMND